VASAAAVSPAGQRSMGLFSESGPTSSARAGGDRADGRRPAVAVDRIGGSGNVVHHRDQPAIECGEILGQECCRNGTLQDASVTAAPLVVARQQVVDPAPDVDAMVSETFEVAGQ
jgi:hypothetical protein